MKNLKLKIKNSNVGMTYIELIVVLAIFSVLSTVVIFNYGDFQDKVDLKNLASDIALKVVEAQKSSLSGLLPTQIPTVSPWKPSYGVYFNLANNQNFTYFTDLNNNTLYDGPDCTGECLNKITITRNDFISTMNVFYQDGTSAPLNDMTVTFTRPDLSAVIKSTQIIQPIASPISYIQITISSPKGFIALIKLYPSGRVQVN